MSIDAHTRNESPSIYELGSDLLYISTGRRLFALAAPFLCVLLYVASALLQWWSLSVIALIVLSFITYGSTSHDLVHGNLGLSRRTNDFLLSLIELLALRSGHAYRLAHLHHHARYPADDDIEGAAAKMSLWRTLIEGMIFQVKIWRWAVKRPSRDHRLIQLEGVSCALIVAVSIAVVPFTPIPLIYVTLMIMGSWIIPLITSYIPHTPDGDDALHQTRMFRGVVASLIAIEHLYHLEHHLYPSVPHQNWPELARRLDPYLLNSGIEPMKIWF